jgi:hypothetical protein
LTGPFGLLLGRLQNPCRFFSSVVSFHNYSGNAYHRSKLSIGECSLKLPIGQTTEICANCFSILILRFMRKSAKQLVIGDGKGEQTKNIVVD